MKRINYYFADGATFSELENVDFEEGEYRDEDGKRESWDEVYPEQHELLPHIIDKHGAVTIIIVSPA